MGKTKEENSCKLTEMPGKIKTMHATKKKKKSQINCLTSYRFLSIDAGFLWKA